MFFFHIEIETSFMPWLMDKTMIHINQLVLGRTILDSIIRDVVNQRIDDYEKLAETLKQVKFGFLINLKNIRFYSKVIEGAIDMGTSTGDVAQGSGQNTDRPDSSHGELILNTENNTNEEGETNASALLHGKFFSWKIIKIINCCLDDTIDEREEDQANAEEDAGGEQ